MTLTRKIKQMPRIEPENGTGLILGIELGFPRWHQEKHMSSKHTLSPEEEAQARALYEEFWEMHPNIKNPTDINRVEKANFLILKGFENVRLMQRARKQKYGFTKWTASG